MLQASQNSTSSRNNLNLLRTETAKNKLKSAFFQKLVSKKTWPLESPTLSSCDFYQWGNLKSVAYNPLPKTLDDLKANLEREIKKIPKNVLNSVFLNLEKSVNPFSKKWRSYRNIIKTNLYSLKKFSLSLQ